MRAKVNRRNWLKVAGLGFAGFGLGQLEVSANTNTPCANKVWESKIFLNANENPYGPSPLARTAMLESVIMSNRYGVQITSELISALASKNKLSKENIVLEAGSTKILDLLLLYTGVKGGSFVMADNTFDYWTSSAKKLNYARISVPLNKDKKHDLNAMLAAIEPDTTMVYVCNPNNPTGTICKTEALQAFIAEASKKTIVVVDEAYIELTDQESLSDLAQENKNLIIARTFSKVYGLAGGRIGYAIAHEETIKKLKGLQSWPSSGVSIVSAAGALASLKDQKFTDDFIVLNEKVKAYTITELERLGIPCISSHTNFIYFSLVNYKKDFFEQLQKHNIVGTKIYEEDGQWSRITIGKMDEMQRFIKALS